MNRLSQRATIERALILAAGSGMRIRSRISDRPKPLIQLGGRSILEWNLDQAARAGIRHVWINLHYEGDQIVELIGDGRQFGVDVRYLHEPELLGTAGTARHLTSAFAGQPFLVVYGDNLTLFDLPEMMAQHVSNAAQVTLAVFDPRTVPNTGMAGGRLALGSDRRILHFEEGTGQGGEYVNAGVYVLEPAILTAIPGRTPCDFGRDVFPELLAQGVPLFGFPIDGCCLGVDTPPALERAERLVESLPLLAVFGKA